MKGRRLPTSKKSLLLFVVMALVAAIHGCSAGNPPSEGALAGARQAITRSGDLVPCAAESFAVASDTGNITVNSQSLIDSYSSSAGAYGGANVSRNAVVQSATSIINNGGVIQGSQRQNAPAGFTVVPVPSGAINLPLGSSSPGSLNINLASQSITLAPGNYVAANINVNSPGAINISPPGQVRIWVTGNLNLGGSENANGIPFNLAFLVTSSGWVNINSGGSLFGIVYAPTSGVNVNSPIFGSVIGSSVGLNSGGAVHFDLSSVCTNASTSSNPGGTDPLPDPPRQPGCYVGTLNGWVAVQCSEPASVLTGFQHFSVGLDGVETVQSIVGGVTNPAVPLVYGQIESTVVSVDTLNQGMGTVNQWSVQNNTNGFACGGSGSGTCIIQFTASQDSQAGKSTVCITNADVLPAGGVTYNNFCVGVNGQNVTDTGLPFDVNTRTGPLKANDFANIAGYAFTQGTQAEVAIVAQFSWVSSQDAVPTTETDLPNRIPGLYAVVTTDAFGLAGKWTSVTGSIIGMDNGAVANFANGEVLTRIAASSCQGDVSASGPTCPGQPALSFSNVLFTTNPPGGGTVETNNLTLVQAPRLTFPNANLVVTDVLASTNVPAGSTTATCLSSVPNHLFVRDNEGDNGGVPSNVGGVPFWESPDIFIVPQGATPPGNNDTAADVQVVAGQAYNVFLRVHNDFGCTPVTGPISVFIDGADPNLGFQNWSPITTGAGSGQYATFGASGAVIVPAFGTAILGPFPWTPPDSGHKCLIAAVAANSETPPTVTIQPGKPVLPPAYGSNQIAQRNIQISNDCSYSITNTGTTAANLLLGISVTPATQTPGSGNGPGITLTFGDPSQTFFNAWNGQSGIVVAHSGTNTTVTLHTSYIALNSVPLPAGQSPSVSIEILPGNGAAPIVNVSALLTDPMTGDIIQANGGSCNSTGQIIIP